MDQKLRDRIKKATAVASGEYANANTKGTIYLKNASFNEGGYKGDCYVFDFVVESSEGKTQNEFFPAGIPHKPGDTFSQVLNMTAGDKKKQDAMASNLVATLQAIQQSLQMAAGEAPTKLDPQADLEIAVIQPDQPFRGLRLSYDTNCKESNGKPMSFLTIKPATKNTPDEVQERRKLLEAP